jgi:hypothetical protein
MIFLKKVDDTVPLFSPSGNLYLAWNLLYMINIFFLCFIITITCTFKMPILALLDKTFFDLSCAIVVLEIIITLNSSFYNNGLIDSSRLSIATRYFKERFFYDMISIFLLFYFTPEAFVQYNELQIFFILHITIFRKVMKKIEETSLISYRTRLFISLIKLLVYNLFFAHIFACVWITMANLSRESDTWITKADL